MTQSNDEFTYDELNFDGLERRGNYRTIAYREDVLHALDRKDPAAIIYQIVYRWQTEYKKPEVLKKIEERKKAGLKPYTPQEIEDMMYVFMSYNDFVRESGGAVGYNTVIRMLDYLVHTKKVLYQRENHNPKYADFEYSVNKNAMRQLLKALPIEPAFAPKIPKKKSKSTQMGTVDNGSDTSTQMGTPTEEIDSTQMGTQSTQTGIASTQMGTEVYPNGGTSHITTHTTNSNHTEESKSALSDDERLTPSPSFANGDDDGTNDANDNRHQSTHHSGSDVSHVRVDLRDSEEVNGQSTSTETAKLNRLTNLPEPLTDENVNADESHARIERETANDTTSSPVIEPAIDEVIHADTRNTTNSYSPSNTAKSTPETEQSNLGVNQSEVTEQTETPTTGKGKRSAGKKSAEKPYETKKPDTLKDRMEQVCLSFEEIGREMFVDPEFRVDRPASPRTELHKALVGFLEQKGSPEGMRLVFTDMWNEEDANGNHFWRDPKHLTLRALCKNYSTRLASVRFNAKQAEKQPTLKDQREGVQRKAAIEAGTMPPVTRQPQNILKAPEGWTARRTAEGGR